MLIFDKKVCVCVCVCVCVELCLKESLCMGVSSKLLLDVTGAQVSELDSSFSLNDRGTNTHILNA